MRLKIEEIVNSNKEEIVKLTQELIKIPSESGKENPIVDFLAKKMTEIGFEVVIDKMGNVIGRIGKGSKIIVIDGHVDTVAIGSERNWKFDPLGGEIYNDNIYGRGACDQKSGVASSLIAIKLLKELGMPKNITIYFVGSVQEEPYEGANWQHIFASTKLKPDVVLLTEPSNLAICRGQRGRVDIKVLVQGLSCHGAEPDEGENAVYKMNPIISEIEKLHHNLPVDETFGKGTITITDIQSKAVSLNAVPYSCTIHLDRRLGTADTLESALEEIKRLKSVQNAEAEVFVPDYTVESYTGYKQKIDGYYPTWLMEESHPAVLTATKAFEKQFNSIPKIITWRFSTNGVAIKGLKGIPTIGFGPGEERFAHTYEEHVKIEQLLKATQFYIAFLIEYAK